jgi:fluoroacetyl-CoA thioesterase
VKIFGWVANSLKIIPIISNQKITVQTFYLRPMKPLFKIGDTKPFERMVRPEDTAAFESGEVHSVYATFALARDAEWCSRLFVLEMKEADEEGIGTFIQVKHVSPALVGERVLFTAVIDELQGNDINCSFTASIGQRLIAEGRTGQKILSRSKIDALFAALKK